MNDQSKCARKLIVACRDANGEADLITVTVEATYTQVEEGEHYDLAEAAAEAQGYEAPFLIFDTPRQRRRLLDAALETNFTPEECA